jgi:hypothetical protein
MLTAAISGCVLIMFLISPGINHNLPSMFGDTIYGKAHKPFVYRTLLPTTARVLSIPVSDKLRNNLSEFIENNIQLKKLFIKLKWEKELAVEYFLATVLMFLSLWGFSIVVRYLFKLFYEVNQLFSDSISLIALIGLPPLFMYTSFVYDFPVLILYTLGLIFLYKQDWKFYLILFFFACINKETTILLTLVYYIYFKKLLKADLFNKLFAAQLVIFILVKVSLFFVYRDNPGSYVEIHLFDHNLRLLTGYDLTLLASMSAIILLIFYKWKEKPEFLKKSLAAFIPLIILSLFLGYIDELRGYYELYPTVVILISYSIARILDLNIKQVRM